MPKIELRGYIIFDIEKNINFSEIFSDRKDRQNKKELYFKVKELIFF